MPSFSAEMSPYRGDPNEVVFLSADVCMPPADAEGFDSPAATKALKGVEPGSFVLFSQEFALVGPDAVSAHFSDVQGLELTREEHSHDVRFGQLVLATHGGGTHTEQVAIKQFDHPSQAAYEIGATMVVNGIEPRRQGSPLSFVPLGFWREQDGKTSMITKYDSSVLTQDIIFWNPNRPPADREVVSALSYAAFALGGIHANGYALGDPQVKNIGRDLRGVRYVDLETMRHVTVGPVALERTTRDLSVYLNSLTSRLEEDHPNSEEAPPNYRDQIVRIFAPRYRKIVSAAYSKVPEEARLQSEEIIGLTE